MWKMNTARGALPATMDNLVSNAYLLGMFARVVILFVVLAIAVVTTVSSAHAASMSIGTAHAAHAGEMMQAASGHSEPSCDSGQDCNSIDSVVCDFVCAGLSVFLMSPDGDAGHEYGTASHDLPFWTRHASRVPALNERPPKLRLP